MILIILIIPNITKIKKLNNIKIKEILYFKTKFGLVLNLDGLVKIIN